MSKIKKVVKRQLPEIKKAENGQYMIHCVGETKTVQEVAGQTDATFIVNRHLRSGQNPFIDTANEAFFRDTTGSLSLRESLDVMNDVRDTFEQLPSHVRDQLYNDPMVMYELLQSKDEVDVNRTYKLGLRVKPVVTPEVIQKVEIVQPKTEVK